MEKYLIVNAGSSSLKFSLYDMPEEKEIVSGTIEKVGQPDSFYSLKTNGEKIKKELYMEDHVAAVNTMFKELINNNYIDCLEEICGIGHRLVFGAEKYTEPVMIDDEVIQHLKDTIDLVPIHHPPQIAVVNRISELMPEVKQVGVFDTSFHSTIPKENYMYAVPYEWYANYGVRKYGFHGMSHNYITNELKSFYNKDDVNAIICHIGSGASVSCIKDGKCFDTSMGLTPLDGVVMGTRSGAIDPSIISYISKKENKSVEEVMNALNNNSGMFGIALKNDFRDLEELQKSGDTHADLALKLAYKSVIKYIAQYYFELEGDVDALVFTAGAGENASFVRKNIVDGLKGAMKVDLNEVENNKIAGFLEKHSGVISTDNSNLDILVIPTNEEKVILDDTYKVCNNTYEYVKKIG